MLAHRGRGGSKGNRSNPTRARISAPERVAGGGTRVEPTEAEPSRGVMRSSTGGWRTGGAHGPGELSRVS